MTIPVSIVIGLWWLHWLGDFILQSDKIAQNKSKDNWVLLAHVAIYTTPFLLFFGPEYAFMNFWLHLFTDFVTSRVAASYYQADKRREFFITIGVDQAIHLTCLVLTYAMVKPEPFFLQADLSKLLSW